MLAEKAVILQHISIRAFIRMDKNAKDQKIDPWEEMIVISSRDKLLRNTFSKGVPLTHSHTLKWLCNNPRKIYSYICNVYFLQIKI